MISAGHTIFLPATTITCYTENNVLIIGIGDDAVAPQNYLIISRLMDTNHTKVDDHIGLQTHLCEYEVTHAIDSVELTANSLIVTINKDKEKALHCQKIIAQFQNNCLDIK